MGIENLQIITIGVYGFDEETFFNKLQEAGVDTFCDLRNHRGLRGRKYAFANSTHLQERLEELGIRYRHFKNLSPSRDIRDIQKKADQNTGTKKRQRSGLSLEFKQAYRVRVLAPYDLEDFLNQLPDDAQKVALFCVEKEPDACHRSLVAKALNDKYGFAVEDILP
jgi:uncharacterized protein (DUF488 family)